MDRQIIYPGQIPLETDLLNAQKNTMIALSKMAAAVLGTSTQVNGLACTQNTVPALNVLVGAGEIYSLQNTDGTAYSSLSTDSHQILKQGILLDAVTLSTPAPGTAGQSINYLVQATYQDVDSGAVVLPYYDASNPAVAYSGPDNAGTTNNTVRKGVCTVAVKAGAAATTGTQTTPSADSGYVGLYVVTVANGQSTVLNANISVYGSAPFITETLIQKISQATADARYMQLTAMATVQGVMKNLVSSATGANANISVAADEIVLENGSNLYQVLRGVSLTVTASASGANGLDTGTLAANTFYSLWIIWNGTLTAGLLSLSATAPTLPSGYTHKARVGWILTDGTGNKYPLSFIQRGRKFQYKTAAGSNLTVLPGIAGAAGNVSTPTFITSSTAAFVPPNVETVRLVVGTGNTNGGVVVAAPNANYGAYTSSNPPPINLNTAGTTGAVYTGIYEMVLETVNIYYASNASTAFLQYLGWDDNL